MRWPFRLRPSFSAPNQVARMPMGLQRSQAYPPAPWITQAGVEQYQNGPQPVAMMPQRMLFTKWKTPPAGYSTQAGASAVNVVQLMQHAKAQQKQFSQMGIEGVPVQTQHMVAQPMNNLPDPRASMYMNPHPIARDFLVRPDVQSSSDLNRLAHEMNTNPTAPGPYRLQRYGPPRLNDANRVRFY